MAKERKDCFLGIHFDFHAMPGEVVAYQFDPDSYREMLDRVKPDFMQFDTKGHAGLSSYPTKAGTQATGIEQDVLRFLREETRKRNIALFGHHSGLLDQAALAEHPDWALINENGLADEYFVSPFSPYVDERLIPQLMELAIDYELDGAWIDGECIGSRVDYSVWAQDAYGKPAPRKGEDGYLAYREFCRQGFRDYVTHYIQQIKKVRPDFQITSNWIFAPQMPEMPTVPVDYLSGDYNCSNAMVSGRRNGRYLAARGITWDLMSWGQHAIPFTWLTHNRTTKGLAQYQQEGSYVIALGGGYQFFNIAYCCGGYLQRWALPIWEKAAAFYRERQICHQAKPWSNIALVAPFEKKDDGEAVLYAQTAATQAMFSWLDALCEIQLSPNIIFESELDRTDLSQYDLIILPSPAKLPSSYAGKVIADGDVNARKQLLWISDGHSLAAMDVPACAGEGRPFGECFTRNYFECDSESVPSAYEKDGHYQLAFHFGSAYRDNVTPTIRNWLRRLIADTSVELPVKVTGSGAVEVITTRKGNDLLVNLINLCGDHRRAEVRAFDEIPPLYHITVQVGDEIRAIEKLDIHKVLVFENYFA